MYIHPQYLNCPISPLLQRLGTDSLHANTSHQSNFLRNLEDTYLNLALRKKPMRSLQTGISGVAPKCIDRMSNSST